MRLIRDTWHAFALGLGNALVRPRHALLVMAGLLIASFTVLVILTIPAGLDRIAGHTGRADIAVVLGSGFLDETAGDIKPELVKRIGVLPGVARRSDGSPLIAPQFVVTTKLKQRDGGMGTVLVRGITPAMWEVAGDSVHVIEGQRPQSGTMQLVAGRVAAGKYPFVRVGSELNLVKRSRTAWKVTGEFAAGHGFWEGELWADIDNLRGKFNAYGQTTAIWVRLTSPDALPAFRAAMHSDPRLQSFQVIGQDKLYRARTGFLSGMVNVASIVIAIVLGAMAILAGNSAVGLALRARRRELAMLRSIGFGNGSLLLALLMEVAVLALICAAVAAVAALLTLHANEVDSQTFGLSIRFAMQVTPAVVGLTAIYACVLGLASALIPALRVLHAPLVKALASE